jgi:hypothetical protein
MNPLLVRIAATCILLMSVAGRASAQAPVRVLVYGEHRGENTVYHYTVANISAGPFGNFVIGSEYNKDEDDTFPRLGRLPPGWRYGVTGETGSEIVLDPASTTQPTGWKAMAYGQEDTGFFYLEWRVASIGAAKGVAPGQSLAGFSVAVPKKPDPRLVRMPKGSEFAYLHSSFTVQVYSPTEGFKKIHGPIERQDTTPPELSLTVSPNTLWPPNHKNAPITVAVSTRDDYDPQPEIKLESITANEPLAAGDVVGAAIGTDDRSFSLKATRSGANPAGRIYTITYSAMDGSGNKATASTTVTVPHDQRK